MAKGGSKVLTAVIAFLLGFIFAILVEIGAVVGVYFYVTRTDLDSIFQTIGIQNKDEEGNYLIINTDKENGGAQTLGDLLDQLKGYLYSEGSSSMDYPVLGKSLDEISNLLPITQKLLAENLYPVVSEYIDIDWEEFEKQPLTDLAQFLSDSVMDIRPAKLLEKFGMEGLVGEGANPIVKALLAGVEFDYAETTSGLKFPVYYDEYVYNSSLSRYYREEAVGGQQAYPANLSEDLLFKTGIQNDDREDVYRLYYIPCSVSDGGLSDARLLKDGETIYEEDTSFYAVKRHKTKKEYELVLQDDYIYRSDYGLHSMDRTGNFYTTNGGEVLQIFPVTIRSFSEVSEVFKPLYSVSVTGLVGGGENNIIGELFGSLSIGELIDGKVNFDEMVSNLSLTQVIDVDPEQSIMAYIGYGITNLDKADTDSYDYKGFVKVDGVSRQCYITYELKGNDAHRAINRVWYYDDDGKVQEVGGTKVKEVASLASGLEISALLEVKADDAILSYLGYGISDIVARSGENGEKYTHVGNVEIENDGVKKQVSCFINTDDKGVITNVWYTDESGAVVIVGGTTINTISDRVSGIMDHLAITDVMDVKWDNAIMVYMGYGVTSVKAQADEDYSHVGKVDVDGNKVTCYIATDEKGIITQIWRMEGGEKIYISGTNVGNVSDRVGKVMENLTLPDLIDIDVDDPIMGYIGYKVSSVKKQSDEGYNRTAKYKTDGKEYDAFLLVGEDGKVENAWYVTEDGNEDLGGVVINDISGMISSLTDNLALPDLIDIDVDDPIMGYIGYGVSNVKKQSDEGYNRIAKYKKDDKTYDAYLLVGEDGKVENAWYVTEDGNVDLGGVVVNDISHIISSLSDSLSLPDVLDITTDGAVTAYIGYGITKIKPADEEDYTHTAVYATEDGEERDCFVLADEDTGKIISVWYTDGDDRVYIDGTKINDLSAKIDGISKNLTLGDVMDVTEDDKILWSLRDAKINELGKKVKTLKIKDVLDDKAIQKSAILRQLKDKSIDEMSTAIDSISIQSIYTREVYKFESEEAVELKKVTEYKNNILYFTKEEDEDGNATYTYVNIELYDDDDPLNDYRVGKILSEEEFNAGVASGTEYYSYGEAKGMWRLILFRSDVETGINGETVYTLNNFSNMISGCTKNIYNATLFDLQGAGILEDEETLNLNKKFGGRTLGEMTFKELMQAVVSMSAPAGN